MRSGMAAEARPYWTGFLKLSLMTIAVGLYSATIEKERIHFHRIHEPSGERVRYQNVVPGLGPVDSSDIVKGYEYQKGRYVTVEPDDLFLEIAEARHAGFELAEQQLHTGRRQRLAQRTLEQPRAVAFAAPVVDAFGQTGLPLIDLLRDDRRDLVDEAHELAALSRHRGAVGCRLGTRIAADRPAEDRAKRVD